MDENKLERLQKIDELLERTAHSSLNSEFDNDLKIDSSDFDSPKEPPKAAPVTPQASDTSEDDNSSFEDVSSKEIHSEPVKAKPIPVENNDDVEMDKTRRIAPVRIIDETSTTVIMEEGPDISVDELTGTNSSAKVKKPKEKVKFSVLQWIIIGVVALITLWFIAFTIDHTLSAQGLTPIFSFQTHEYADGSLSYMGAGYKIQFQFDSDDNLTQKCVPFWKDGPNDEKFESDSDSQKEAEDSASFSE